MRIADLRVHSIAIADPPLRSSYGLHAPFALRTILELESEDGIIGISETHGGDANARMFASLRPQLVGQDAYRLCGPILSLADGAQGDRSQTHWPPGENPVDAAARLYSAIEIAALDLVGKSIGIPVCDLVGGRIREEVPFSAYLFYKHAGAGGFDGAEDVYGECLDPRSIVRQANQMIATHGFRSVKLKAGVLDPDMEIETMRRLSSQLGPTVPLRIDPNCAWRVETSMQVARALEKELAGGGYLEDPTPGLDGMAALRHQMLAEEIETPLASNVAVTSFAHLAEAVRSDAVQIVLCDPHYWGGIREIQHLAKVCATFSLGLSMHSNSHLGVSLMAMAHAAAAAPHLTYACDTHYPWQADADEVTAGGKIPIVGGSVHVPDKPGLGVELDYDRLARGRERYERIPFRKRDDEEEMRKHIDPAWRRVVPRW